jgi:hypothetical protein
MLSLVVAKKAELAAKIILGTVIHARGKFLGLGGFGREPRHAVTIQNSRTFIYMVDVVFR